MGTGTFVWRKEIALQSYFHRILSPVLENSSVNSELEELQCTQSPQKDGYFDFVHVSV